MRDNMTNREEIELVKSWWNDYGKSILIAVIIGLVLGYGWRYWVQYKAERSINASATYQELLAADVSGFTGIDKNALVKTLTSKYKATPYAPMAEFLVAKDAVNDKQFKTAAASLHWVMDNADMKSLKELARIRLARVMLGQKKASAAITVLNTVDDKAYMPMIDTVKGDAYFSQGKRTQANSAYKNALAAYALMGVDSPVLKLKLSQ
jgi:predicted negative regulator of RcsB-dependent stress response